MNLLDPAALESLAALAEAGSFERAAQLLSVTQSAVSQRLRALETQVGQLLGHMRDIAVASPAFIAQAMPAGLNEANFARLPFIVFNRKDDMQAQWVARAMGVRDPRLKERFVPSSEAGARAGLAGGDEA